MIAITKKQKAHLMMISRYSAVFGSEDGKKVLHDLMKSSGMLDSIFSNDPQEHAYNEGQRNMVLRILRTINTDPAELEGHFEKVGQLEDTYEI